MEPSAKRSKLNDSGSARPLPPVGPALGVAANQAAAIEAQYQRDLQRAIAASLGQGVIDVDELPDKPAELLAAEAQEREDEDEDDEDDEKGEEKVRVPLEPFEDHFKDEKMDIQLNPSIHSSIPLVSDEALPNYANIAAIRAGKDRYSAGQPKIVLSQPGNIVIAAVDDHTAAAKCAPDGRLLSSRCTCNADRPCCGHVVALLMFCYRTPQAISKPTELTNLIESFKQRESIESLVTKAILRNPAIFKAFKDLEANSTPLPQEQLESGISVLELRKLWEEILAEGVDIRQDVELKHMLEMWCFCITNMCIQGQVHRAFENAARLMEDIRHSSFDRILTTRRREDAYDSDSDDDSDIDDSDEDGYGYYDDGWERMRRKRERRDRIRDERSADSTNELDYSKDFSKRPYRRASSTTFNYRAAMFELWKHLALFATCPFVGLAEKDLDELLAIAEKATRTSYQDQVVKTDWNDEVLIECMETGKPTGGEQNTPLKTIEPIQFIRFRIDILFAIGRIEEALNLASAAELKSVVESIFNGQWHAFRTTAPTEDAENLDASGAAVPPASAGLGEGEVDFETSYQKAITLPVLPAATALPLARQAFANGDMTGAFLLARLGLRTDSPATRSILQWVVTTLLKLEDSPPTVPFNPVSNVKVRDVGNCIPSLQFLASRHLAPPLNTQSSASVEQVLRSIPVDAARIVMLDLVADSVKSMAPFSRELASTLAQLGSYLIKVGYITHSLEFFTQSITTLTGQTSRVFGLARSQGLDSFAKLMRRCMAQNTSQVNDHGKNGIKCIDYGLYDVGCDLLIRYMHSVKFCPASVAQLCVNAAPNREKARLVAGRILDWADMRPEMLVAFIPTAYCVAMMCMQSGFYQESLTALVKIAELLNTNEVRQDNSTYSTSSYSINYVVPLIEKNRYYAQNPDMAFKVPTIPNAATIDEPSLDRIRIDLIPLLQRALEKFPEGSRMVSQLFSSLVTSDSSRWILKNRLWFAESCVSANLPGHQAFCLSLLCAAFNYWIQSPGSHNMSLAGIYLGGLFPPTHDTPRPELILSVLSALPDEYLEMHGKGTKTPQPITMPIQPGTATIGQLMLAREVLRFMVAPSKQAFTRLLADYGTWRFAVGAWRNITLIETLAEWTKQNKEAWNKIITWAGREDLILRSHRLKEEFSYSDQSNIVSSSLFALAKYFKQPGTAAINNELYEVMRSFVWRTWGRVGNGQTIDQQITQILDNTPWLPKVAELKAAHVVLSAVRNMLVGGNKTSYNRLIAALKVAKEFCKKVNQVPNWAANLDHAKSSQRSRSVCVKMLSEL